MRYGPHVSGEYINVRELGQWQGLSDGGTLYGDFNHMRIAIRRRIHAVNGARF
jgi:hypothetical protein